METAVYQTGEKVSKLDMAHPQKSKLYSLYSTVP
jgi:hypothetical protein